MTPLGTRTIFLSRLLFRVTRALVLPDKGKSLSDYRLDPFLLKEIKQNDKSYRNNAGFMRLSHWMLYGTTRFRPGRNQPPAIYSPKMAISRKR